MQPNYYNNMYGGYQPYQQQPYQQQPQRFNNKIDFFIVPTEDEARRYILNVGQTVLFKVADKNIMIERTLDMNGNSSINLYDLRGNNAKSDKGEYVTRSEFDDLVFQFRNFENYLRDKKGEVKDEH